MSSWIVILASTMSLLTASSWSQISDELWKITCAQVERIEVLRREMEFLKDHSGMSDHAEILTIFDWMPRARRSVSIRLMQDRIAGLEALKEQFPSPWYFFASAPAPNVLSPSLESIRLALLETTEDKLALRNLAYQRRQFFLEKITNVIVEQEAMFDQIKATLPDVTLTPIIGDVEEIFLARQKNFAKIMAENTHINWSSLRRRCMEWEAHYAVWRLYKTMQVSIRWEEELEIGIRFIWDASGSMIEECMRKLKVERIDFKTVPAPLLFRHVLNRVSFLKKLVRSHLLVLPEEYAQWPTVLEGRLTSIRHLLEILDFPNS